MSGFWLFSQDGSIFSDRSEEDEREREESMFWAGGTGKMYMPSIALGRMQVEQVWEGQK